MSDVNVDDGASVPADAPATPAASPSPARERGQDGKFAAKAGDAPAAPVAPQAPARGATIAAGDQTTQTPPPAPSWREDWREAMARTHAGNDEKAYAKELKRLQRFTDPTAIYGTARELEARFNEGGLVKIPGPKATDEEKAAYRKAIGVPEKPEDYAKSIKLANNRVLGENDKPIFDAFAQALHKVDAPPAIVNAATDWFLDYQTAQAEEREIADAEFHDASADTLKKELGSGYEKSAGAIGTLFATAPPGVKDLLLNGRTADGHKLGDHPAVVKFLASLALELNPAATLVGGGDMNAKGVDSRIGEIEKFMRTNRAEYFKNTSMQEELQHLYSARDQYRARNNAA